MADQVIGNAVVNIKIDESQVNREAVKAGTKCADVFSKTVNAALGKSDPLASFDKLVSKQRSVIIKINTSAANKSIDALEGRLRGFGGTNLPPLKVPVPNTKPATDAIEKLARIAADTAKMSIKVDIGVNKSLGKDTRELEKQLAVTQELERHRRKLSDVSKLRLDSSDLDAAKKSLDDLHKKSLKSIDIKFDTKKTKSAFDGLGKSLGQSLSAGTSGAIAGIAASVTGTITNAVGAGMRGAVGIIGDRTETRNIDTQSRKIGTLGGDEKESRSLATQVQKDTGFTTSQADILGAMYEVNSSGFSKAADAAKILTASQKAAVAGATELMVVQDAVTSILNSYSMSADEATTVTNQMAGAVNAGKISYEQYSSLIGKITAGASSAGVSLIDLNSIIALGTANGLKAEASITGVGQAISSIAKPSAQAAKLADSMGIEFSAAALKSKGLVGVLKTIEDAGGGDYGTLLQLFGSVEAAAAIMPVFNKGFAALGDISNQISGTNGEDAFKLQLQSMANLEKRSAEIARNIKIQFETSMAPAVEAVMSAVSGVLENLNSAGLFEQLNIGAQTFADTLKSNPEIIKQISDAIAALATEGFTFINEQVQQFTEYLKQNPAAIQETINSTKELITDLAAIVGFVAEMTKGFAQNSQSAFDLSIILGAIADVIGIATGQSESFGGALGKAFAFAQDILNTINGFGILSSIVQLANDIGNSFNVIDIIGKSVLGTQQAVGGILGENSIVSQTIAKIWEIILGLIKALLSPITNVFKVIDLAVQKTGVFRDQWNGLISIVGSVGNAINQICGGALDSIISKAQQFASTLQSMLGMGGSGGSGAPLDSKTNTFKDVVVTAAVDGSGEPGMDYVTEANNGQNGENAWVPSLTAGKVIETRRDDRKLGLGGERGYGNVAIVRTMDEKSGEFVDILYAHFNELAVKVGDEVAVGTVLGTQGTTGSTSGPHTSVDFFGKDSNQPTQASLAMRDRLARDLSSGAKDLNSKIGQRQAQGGGMVAGVSMIDGTFGNGAVGGGMSQQQVMAMLEGGGNSQIAKLVGMAEGNRTADGSKTKNYYGHVDPNNGAYNIGSFSAQGSYNTGNAETSDQRVIDQLLRPNIQKLYESASKNQVAVTPKLMMNYIDLLNQAPDAATGWSNGAGFLGNIASVRGRENDDEALKTLRAEGFRNKQGRLETTFDSLESLRYDQGRRQGEINTALGAFNLGSKGPQVSSTPSSRSPLGKSPMASTGDSEIDDIKTKREEREEAERRKAVEESRRYQDSETKARREAKKKGRDIARKQELAEIEKQSAGITDPSLRKALDLKKANLTTGAQSNDRIDELKDELSDLSTGLRRKQADLKSGGDVADKAKLLPNYSKAIAETKALISQEEKLRDTLLGVSSAENTASINAEKLAQARQKRDANREKEYQAKVSIAERDKAVVASVGMPTDKIDNQIADYKRQYEGTKEIQVKIDQRQDLQSDLTKYQATLGKGKTDEQVKLKQGALTLIDKEIEAIKKKYADEGIVLNLKIAAADRDEAIRDRNRTQQFEFDDKMLTMEGQLALAQQQEDQYAGLIELDIERERKLFDITKRLNEQNDALAKYNDSMAALQQNGVSLDSPAFKDMNNQLDTVRQNIALINQEKLQVIEQAELKKLKTAEEITARLAKLKAEVANEQFDATSKIRRSAINKRRERFGKYDSQSINEERTLIGDEKDQKIKEGRSAIQEQVKERARAGYKMTAEEIQNLDNVLTLAAENEYFDRLREIPNIGREIGQSLGENLTGALKDLILTGKSLGEVMSNVFANLASQLLDLGFSGLFGGKGLGGLLGGLFGGKGAAKGGVVGAYKGGTVQNYARGKDSNIFGSILEAADRERSQSGGKTPKLAMVNASEIIIDAQTSDRLRKLTSNKIPNFAMGQNLDNLPVTNNITGCGINVNVGGVSVTSGNPNVDQKALQASIRGAITDQLLREKRPGGILA